MTSQINTILLIGATSGIGEAILRRFHNLGKTIIATGRNRGKLESLAAELPGIETRVLDISDLASLPTNLSKILEDFPSLDTVFVTAGIQKSFSLFDPSDIETKSDTIVQEITTNLTAPSLLIQLLSPHLLQRAKSGKKATIFITSSSIGYIPLGFYPTYCATKSGVQALVKSFRQQLSFQGPEAIRNINIVEVIPPYVDTGLDKEHRAHIEAMQGGEGKGFPAMPLKEFIDQLFESLDQLAPDGSIKKEIGVGFGDVAIRAWRGSFDAIYEQMGLSV
ncbi:NAD(P)-binding protein [Xylaria digitata]|nr:NAD(P)-binding protein [Xylaria digitata]